MLISHIEFICNYFIFKDIHAFFELNKNLKFKHQDRIIPKCEIRVGLFLFRFVLNNIKNV